MSFTAQLFLVHLAFTLLYCASLASAASDSNKPQRGLTVSECVCNVSLPPPFRFRTKYCKEGAECKRTVCFFAHSPQQLRQPGDYVPRPAVSNSSSSSPNAHGLPLASNACGNSMGGSANNQSMLPAPLMMSSVVHSAPAAAGPAGAACYHPSNGYSSGGHSNSDMAASAAADLQTQQQIALLLQQQQQASDTASVAHPAAVQLQDAATSQAAAAELTRLKAEYADRMREAGLAAAKAAEASSQLQQLAAALDVPSHQPAATVARTSPSASHRLQLESAQRLSANLSGLGYAPATSAAVAASAGCGVGALLGGSGLEAASNRNMSLESQLMGLSMNSSGHGVLPQASAAPAAHGMSPAGFSGQLHSANVLQSAASMLQSSASWQSEEVTLASMLGLAGHTTDSSLGSSGGQLLPGDQVLSAFLMSPQQQQQLHQASMEMPTGGSGGHLLPGDQTLSACLLSAAQQHEADTRMAINGSGGHLLPGDETLSALLMAQQLQQQHQQQHMYTGLSGGSSAGHMMPGDEVLSAFLLSQQQQY